MTLDEVLHRVARRWYVYVTVYAVALAAALPVLRSDPVFHSQVDVVLLAPGATLIDPVVEGRADGLIAFGGLVEREMNDGAQVTRLSSSIASLYGAGVRQGQSVVVPNFGGQWENDFSRPVLSVEVVDTSPEHVRAVMRQTLLEVDEVVLNLQRVQNVPPTGYITAVPVPSHPPVSYVGATASGRSRAVLVLATLSAVVAILASVAFDRWSARRCVSLAVPETSG